MVAEKVEAAFDPADEESCSLLRCICRLLADSVAKVGQTDLRRNDCSSMDSVLNLSFKVGAADESMLRAR